jgi:undecaprenyl-diphosphatase
MIDGVVIATRVLAVVLLGGLLAWALHGRRWRMLGTVIAAGVAAAVVVTLVEAAVASEQAPALVEVGVDLGPLTSSGFPSTAGVSALAGVLTAAAPWLGRRVRQASWALMLGLIVTAFVVAPTSVDAVLAGAVGWLVGAAVLVAAGTPSRRPTAQSVIDGLGAVGVPVRRLDRAGVDARGSTPYFGVGADGSPLFVKALGTNERSADLLFRTYRRLLPRDLGDQRAFVSLQRSVEHEALVALAARAIGVRTPALRAVAIAAPDGAVLAYDAIDGRSLDRVDAREVTDDVLAAIWRLVGELRRHRVAHRDLRLANIFLDDRGEVWLIDFGFGEMVASDLLLATDVAELIASSSLCVGPERAVAPAVGTVDRATLARALDRLRPWALSGATRSALKARAGHLDELRVRVTRASGTMAR